jgi:hypothetical protein
MRRQLDFFQAEILVFPVDRRIAEVRSAASAMNRLRGGPAKAFWKNLINDLSRPLSAAGIRPEEVERQMMAFREEVGAEMWRQQQGDSRRPGGNR